MNQLAFAQIDVDLPAEGDVIYQGDQAVINWQWESTPPEYVNGVTVDLYRNNQLWDTNIATGGKWESYLIWDVPNNLAPDSTYHVRVKGDYGGGWGDSGTFIISDAYLEFDSGYDGSTVEVDQGFSFTWDHNMTKGLFELEYYAGNGWQPIATIGSNNTAHGWNPPDSLAGKTAKIQISNTEYPGLADQITNLSLIDYYISVSAPPDGQGYRDGDQIAINWETHNYDAGNVGIELYKDGNKEKSLFSSTTDDGSASWTVDVATASSAGNSIFHIEVFELVGPGEMRGPEYGSSGTFTLKRNQLAFDTGLEGSKIRSGDPFEVSWTDNINKGQLELTYYHASTGWSPLATVDTTETGYTWNTPDSLSGPVKVSIASTYYTGVADTLQNLELVRYLDVTGPLSGDTWKIGNTEQIYWQSNAGEQQVDIELLDVNENPLGVIAAGVATYASGSNGSYLWDIQDTLPDGTPVAGNTDYKIRVATTNNNVLGVSGVFTVAFADYISISAPTDDNGYNPGGKMTITFASNVGRVDIDLAGPYSRTIATGYQGHATSPPDGKVWQNYIWQVPQNLPEGDYYVRIIGGTAMAISGTFRVGVGETLRLISYDDYDQQGNVLQATGANGHISRYYYGSQASPFSQAGLNGTPGVYLTGISRVNPGGGDSLTIRAHYNDLGQMDTLVNQAGVRFSFGYDGLGRLDTVYNAAGDPVTAYAYLYTGSLFGPSNPNSITTTGFAGAGGRGSVVYFDGLGRPVQTQQEGDGSTIVRALQYDVHGREWRTWKPYPKAGTMGYDPNFVISDTAYYGNARPFREQLYEASPLNRPDSMIVEGGPSAGIIRQAYGVGPGDTTSTTYQVTTSTDESGRITKSYADGWGRTVRTVADPDSIAAGTVFEYDVLDRLTKVTAPNGLETTYSYDTRGNLTKKTSPDAGTVRYRYDGAGNLRFSQDANQSQAEEVLFTSYDFANRPLTGGIADTVFSALQGEDSYFFESDPAHRRHLRAWDATPDERLFPWDQFSAELSNFTPQNPDGQLVAEAYRFTDTTTVAGSNFWQLTLYDYDPEGRLAAKQIHTGDREDWATYLNYTYNRLGELTRQKITIGGKTLYRHYSWNRRGLLDSMWVSSDGIIDTEPPEVTYTYTATGAIDNITYRGGASVNYAYTLREWVESINDITNPGNSFAASYDYHKNGNIALTEFHNPLIQDASVPNRYSYAYSYDGLSRLTGADYSGGGTTTAYDVTGLQYDPSGNITALQRYGQTNGLIDSLAYFYTGNRLTQLEDGIIDSTGGGGQVTTTEDPVFEESLVEPWMDVSWSASVDYTSTDYAYEGTTSIRVDNDTWGALSVHYDYWGSPEVIGAGAYEYLRLMIYPPDSTLVMRLVLENDAGQSFPAVSLGSIPAGQWTSVEVALDRLNPGGYDWQRIDLLEDSGELRTYYVDNFKLAGSDTTRTGPVAWDAETADFGYDANGNLISQSGKFSGIQYDHRNLPVRFTMEDGDTLRAAYNADGQRILKETSSGAWQFYVMDGQQTIAVIDQSGLSHFNLVGNNTFGRLEANNGSIDTTNARRYYLSDHLGSTRAVVDDQGQVLETFDYYPFGLLMPKRNTAGAGTIEKYTGHELDDEGGVNLFYAGARYLDPALGRWMSVDPKADDFPAWSPYNYTFDNPVNLFDPDGEAPCCLIPIGVAETKDNIAAALGDKQAQQRVKARWAVRGGVASLAIPGPEDVAFGAFLATKAGRAALRFADEAAGFVKGLFKSSDEVVEVGAKASDSASDFASQIGDVENERLTNTLNELFRKGDEIPGGTAGAIRRELKTGELVGGKSHITKGQERVKNLQRVLKNEDLNEFDRNLAQQVLDDLQNALGGN